MRVKLDENLSRRLTPALQQAGHDVSSVEDEGLLGRSDETVGAAAATEGRVLFTLDLEFADLRKHPPGRHPGIVLFRPPSMGPMAVNRFVEAFLAGEDMSALSGCIVIVEPGRIRLRRPPLDTSGPEWRDIPPQE
jgi:predicted nuclease of predicted toxin-antitoxin system